ncbi:MAG: hypothetical protein LC749_11230, partial [Actinobacteria bacterium]|nr:hypothetical protein [Actinomycetota bacterium]
KLIDFDSSYLVGSPPPPEEIVGTMNYYSPELVSYIQGSVGATDLTESSDIFALGLIYAEYLTGALPTFDPAYHEAAIAVLNGAQLRLAPGHASARLVALVVQMLLVDPAARPTVAEVHKTLMGLRSETPTLGRAPLRTPSTGRAPRRLRLPSTPAEPGSTAHAVAPRPATAGPAALPQPSPRGSTLRGKGLRLVADAVRPAPDGPPPSRGRALLGKLIDKLEERRSR